MRLRSKDLLGLEELSVEEIRSLLEAARRYRRAYAAGERLNSLRGRRVVNLFYEPSTRTRTSFEIAARSLGADVVNINVAASSMVKGESLLDTVTTLESMGLACLVIRHSSAGVPHFLASRIRAAVVNAGDGWHEHPTQALLDLLTIQERKGRLHGLKVAIIGDILHSRVARSDLWGLSKVGAEVWLCGPPTLLPPALGQMGARITWRPEEALEGADVVIALRLQGERQVQGLLPSLREYRRLYRLTPERLSLAAPDAVLMHPGPVNRGVELSPELLEDPRSAIAEQVTNGVAVRMAVLSLLLGGE